MLFARLRYLSSTAGNLGNIGRRLVEADRQIGRQQAEGISVGRKGRKMLKRVREVVEAQVGDSRRGSGRNGVIALCLCGGRVAE